MKQTKAVVGAANKVYSNTHAIPSKAPAKKRKMPKVTPFKPTKGQKYPNT